MKVIITTLIVLISFVIIVFAAGYIGCIVEHRNNIEKKLKFNNVTKIKYQQYKAIKAINPSKWIEYEDYVYYIGEDVCHYFYFSWYDTCIYKAEKEEEKTNAKEQEALTSYSKVLADIRKDSKKEVEKAQKEVDERVEKARELTRRINLMYHIPLASKVEYDLDSVSTKDQADNIMKNMNHRPLDYGHGVVYYIGEDGCVNYMWSDASQKLYKISD